MYKNVGTEINKERRRLQNTDADITQSHSQGTGPKTEGEVGSQVRAN
jgi:hypothetical protein